MVHARPEDFENAPEHIRRQIPGLGKKKGNKLNAQRATDQRGLYPELAGRSFASKLERDRAQELVLLRRGGQIKDLAFQPRVFMTKARISYHADFYYRERVAPRKFRKVWEDAKGVNTDRWRLIKRLWEHYGPGLLRVTQRGKAGIVTTKEIFPK